MAKASNTFKAGQSDNPTEGLAAKGAVPAARPRDPDATRFTPGEAEAKVVAGLLPKIRGRAKIRLKVDRGSKGISVGADYPDLAAGLVLLMGEFGTVDADFVDAVVQQLINLSTAGPEPEQKSLNNALAMLKGISPSDELECMLALQMVTVHMTAMKHARMLNHAETFPQLDIQERTVNKLMRTFTMQMEALKKHRTGGQQQVVVKHVTVKEGGQAIVGNVSYGGRSTANSGGQSLESNVSFSIGPSMQGHVEAYRQALPSPGSERLQSVPLPRCGSGSAARPAERQLSNRAIHRGSRQRAAVHHDPDQTVSETAGAA